MTTTPSPTPSPGHGPGHGPKAPDQYAPHIHTLATRLTAEIPHPAPRSRATPTKPKPRAKPRAKAAPRGKAATTTDPLPGQLPLLGGDSGGPSGMPVGDPRGPHWATP